MWSQHILWSCLENSRRTIQYIVGFLWRNCINIRQHKSEFHSTNDGAMYHLRALINMTLYIHESSVAGGGNNILQHEVDYPRDSILGIKVNLAFLHSLANLQKSFQQSNGSCKLVTLITLIITFLSQTAGETVIYQTIQSKCKVHRWWKNPSSHGNAHLQDILWLLQRNRHEIDGCFNKHWQNE